MLEQDEKRSLHRMWLVSFLLGINLKYKVNFEFHLVIKINERIEHVALLSWHYIKKLTRIVHI